MSLEIVFSHRGHGEHRVKLQIADSCLNSAIRNPQSAIRNPRGSIATKVKREGFTLIELLVAMSIFSVVVASLYAGLSMCLKIWRRGEKELAANQDARLLVHRLAEDLRAVYPPAAWGVTGDEKAISFFAVAPTFDSKREPGDRGMHVTYRLGSSGATSMSGGGQSLIREERILSGEMPFFTQFTTLREIEQIVQAVKSYSQPTRTTIADGLQDLRFEYFWTRRWYAQCQVGDGLPSRVKVDFSLREPEDENAPVKRFTTTITHNLPIGPGPPQEQQF